MARMPRTRYKTARCVLYRPRSHSDPTQYEFLLAIHGSFWGKRVKRWGLPGGRVEWREDPQEAAVRELEEELDIQVRSYEELADFTYKRAQHKVICARWDADIPTFDKQELIDIRWFSAADIQQLAKDKLLHARYEIDAIRLLEGRLRLA